MAEIIVALDMPADAARRLLDRLPEVAWVKIGSILFAREGPPLVRELVGRGLKVFLDLKWHDIPSTVAGAVAAAAELGVAMATVHTLGGPGMMEAAARAAGAELGLLGVTVLTSHSRESYAATLGRRRVVLEDEVCRLAALAVDAGLRGVVCSPLETAAVRGRVPQSGWIVVPGIRRAADQAGDQVRTATPREASRSGATHLVVGRPILEAAHPAAVYREMTAEAR